MIDILRKFYPDISHIEDAFLKDFGSVIGWHSVIVDASGKALGGGCSASKETARRVACAEAIERFHFSRLIEMQPKTMLLDEFPTTCGFAAGFENDSTMLRAIAEAVERWAWSSWIDHKCFIDKYIPRENELGQIAGHFFNYFEEVRFYKKKILICIGAQKVWLQFGSVVGISAGGAFPGSRVCSMNESPWEHALVEAWRHTLIAKDSENQTPKDSIYRNRVKFFSRNRDKAISAIPVSGEITEWKEPKLRYLDSLKDLPSELFIWRAICADYVGWHLGDETRFVY